MSKVFVLGVAGGSGSGKTTFAKALLELFAPEDCSLLFQDNYYIDQSHRFDRDGGSVNFDHPDSLDFPLLTEHLKRLKQGQSVEVPLYDFASHKRIPQTYALKPKKILILDGILIFHPPELRGFMDERVYFDTPEKVRFERRLERDVRERGRTPEGVREQFFRQVKPMHDQFVEPTQAYAHRVIRTQEALLQALKEYFERLSSQ